MTQLFDAVNNLTTTTNGDGAFKSTLNSNLDLFFKIATARGQDMSGLFDAAYQEDPELALRILQWGRDVRGGAGERARFRDLLQHIAQKEGQENVVIALLNKIPEIGRFDDVLALVGTKYEDSALGVIAKGIKDKNGLAAKWAPRKGENAVKLRSILGMTPKQYRKTVVNLTQVVETQMCASEWDKIEYRKVPSVAARNYGRAFKRHDEERYTGYLDAVLEGKEKINASAIFPHDVLRDLNDDTAKRVQAQWDNLPDYLEGNNERILPVVDVSASMNDNGGLPMQISVALGLYFSQRGEGLFKDSVITFETTPQFIKFNPGMTIVDRVRSIRSIPWGGSTDFVAVFNILLAAARMNKIPADQMPTKLLCVSDMQFNQSTRTEAWNNSFQEIKRLYAESGYEMPQLVFWNVAGSNTGNVPITFNETGVALVSGASPAIVTSVLGGDLDPIAVMKKAVEIPRYDISF